MLGRGGTGKIHKPIFFGPGTPGGPVPPPHRGGGGGPRHTRGGGGTSKKAFFLSGHQGGPGGGPPPPGVWGGGQVSFVVLLGKRQEKGPGGGGYLFQRSVIDTNFFHHEDKKNGSGGTRGQRREREQNRCFRILQMVSFCSMISVYKRVPVFALTLVSPVPPGWPESPTPRLSSFGVARFVVLLGKGGKEGSWGGGGEPPRIHHGSDPRVARPGAGLGTLGGKKKKAFGFVPGWAQWGGDGRGANLVGGKFCTGFPRGGGCFFPRPLGEN